MESLYGSTVLRHSVMFIAFTGCTCTGHRRVLRALVVRHCITSDCQRALSFEPNCALNGAIYPTIFVLACTHTRRKRIALNSTEITHTAKVLHGLFQDRYRHTAALKECSNAREWPGTISLHTHTRWLDQPVAAKEKKIILSLYLYL